MIFVDSGIAANEVASDARALLRPGAPFGPLLESFVLSELSRQLTWSEQLADLSHYRDQGRYEVDAVLENRSGHVVGIEVKAATTIGPDDFRGLRRVADRLGDDFIAGIVLYTGTSTLPFGDKLRAMPASALWQVPAPTAAEFDLPLTVLMFSLRDAAAVPAGDFRLSATTVPPGLMNPVRLPASSRTRRPGAWPPIGDAMACAARGSLGKRAGKPGCMGRRPVAPRSSRRRTVRRYRPRNSAARAYRRWKVSSGSSASATVRTRAR
jgi:uncharacterized protein DUF4143